MVQQTLAKCGRCAALASRLGARFCEYCGSELPKDVIQAPSLPNGPGGVSQHSAARFEALHAHPAAAQINQESMLGVGKRGMRGSVVAGCILLFAGVMALSNMRGFDSTHSPAVFSPGFAVMPLLPLGVFGLGALFHFVKQVEFNGKPVHRHPALVIDERVEVRGGRQSRRVRTKYFTTLEFEDGSRHEFPANLEATREGAAGDIGFALTKGRELVGFRRVPV